MVQLRLDHRETALERFSKDLRTRIDAAKAQAGERLVARILEFWKQIGWTVALLTAHEPSELGSEHCTLNERIRAHEKSLAGSHYGRGRRSCQTHRQDFKMSNSTPFER
jgi:hypothetical protein